MDGELSFVDASSAWMAETYDLCQTAERLCELGRHKLTKAAWARMLSPWKALQKVHGILPPEAAPEGRPDLYLSFEMEEEGEEEAGYKLG